MCMCSCVEMRLQHIHAYTTTVYGVLPDVPSCELHQIVYRCLMACDIDTRKDFFCNVIISGGNTRFLGTFITLCLPNNITRTYDLIFNIHVYST